MIKNIYNVPFTGRQLGTIERKMRETIDEYLEKNYEVSLSSKDYEYLIGKAKDQTSVYIKELSTLNEPWGMSHSTIPITVYSKTPRKQGDLLSESNKSKERFYKEKGKWRISDDPKKGMSYDTFVKEVFRDIYERSKIAAFYAVDSFENAKMRYPNG